MSAIADRELVRDLARKYQEIAVDPVQDERRRLWRAQNSLRSTRPLIYMRAFGWSGLPESRCQCEDSFLRGWEAQLRHLLYWASLKDDSIFEPWLTVTARYRCSGWGVSPRRITSDTPGGSYKDEYPIREPEDLKKLRAPWHEIDEDATAAALGRAQDLLGDIITINLDRGPAYRMWTADLSTDLGHLRGIENFMLDMMDRPQWLHELVGFMSAGVLRVQDAAEAAGDFGLCNHQNQAMPYAEELADPAPNALGVRRSELWGYAASQEFTLVSPAMWDEFLFQYQMTILRPYGLVAYGCCEDLTRKIPLLRQLPNLRRIGIAPAANVPACVEQIGRDYVVSYRPSPADMVGYGFDPERVRRILREDLTTCRGTHVDVTLKDVETVQGDSERPRKWVELARSVIDEVFG
jgi:hypothetical protein